MPTDATSSAPLSPSAEARAGLARLLRGDPPTEGAEPWDDADIRRLWALVQLGRPADVVSNGPAPVIAKGDNWGGRMPMPGEGVRASALHAWREVSRACGLPLPAPHDVGRKR